MEHKKIISCMLVCFLTVIASCVRIGHCQPVTSERFSCSVQAAPQKVVVFEPLRLNVKVRYEGEKTIKASLPTDARDRIGIAIRKLDEPKKAINYLASIQLYTDAFADSMLPMPRSLPAGASSMFPIAMIYDWHDQRFLFDSPGLYEVQVSCRVLLETEEGALKEEVVDGKTTVTVQDYEGEEIDLWEKIVLSKSVIKPIDEATVQELSEFLQQYPRSPYRPYVLALSGGVFGRVNDKQVTTTRQITHLQEVLKNYPKFAWKDQVAANLYRLLMNEGEIEQAQEVVKILFDDPWAPPSLKYQIQQFEPSILFPKDKRLDQSVTYHFAQPTPYAEVLAEISRRTGVPLNPSPELPKYKFSSLKSTESLRVAMRRLGAGLIWIRDGDGYKLMPKVNDETP